jgi:phospholipase C
MPSPITNIIVVMLENRSYDNMLGWAYNLGTQPYTQAPAGQGGLLGLTGKETNPNPADPKGTIQISNSTETTNPASDPGEGFCDMAQQIFGLSAVPTTDPWTATTPPTPATMTMQGFTTNYAVVQPGADPGDCIAYFTPDQVPVTAFLAYNYAVCDQWYASVPCQTFTNRVFSICAAPAVHKPIIGSSYSLVNDMQYLTANAVFNNIADQPSIFCALDQAFPNSTPPNWKVYFFDYSISAITVPYVYQAAIGDKNVNVATYDDSDWGSKTPRPAIIGEPLGSIPPTFVTDLANGKLPKLSLIEPRYSTDVANSGYLPNSNHPGDSALLPFLPTHNDAIDVAQGESFLAEVYNALVGSSISDSFLLIVTYDEHGGMFDHMPPACNAASPGKTVPPAKDPGFGGDPSVEGFTFNYFGCRVPAIIVSPLIQAGTTISPPGSSPFDHTSIIKTVWDCFQLGSGSLTNRDAAAPSLMPFLCSTPCNTTGAYSGADGPAPAQARSSQPPIPRDKTPEEAEALFKVRLTKSLRS